MTMLAVPQLLRWATNDGRPAGALISTNPAYSIQPQEFVEWPELNTELKELVCPQLLRRPSEWTFRLDSFDEHANWLMRLVRSDQSESFDVWVGVNPDHWTWDGLLHVGRLCDEIKVYQSFQRYSDKSYRRVFALINPLDQPLPSKRYGFDLRGGTERHL